MMTLKNTIFLTFWYTETKIWFSLKHIRYLKHNTTCNGHYSNKYKFCGDGNTSPTLYQIIENTMWQHCKPNDPPRSTLL